MPPSNMQNISSSLTNQIADILYVDDNAMLWIVGLNISWMCISGQDVDFDPFSCIYDQN